MNVVRELDPTLPIIAFQIKGWKTERWGVYVDESNGNSVHLHDSEHTISKTIADLLKMYELKPEHVINITAARNSEGDVGSHDFWLFIRNPQFIGA